MALEAPRVGVGLSLLALALAACRKPTEALKAGSPTDAEALAALIRSRMSGSKPSVVCEPITEISRKIPLE